MINIIRALCKYFPQKFKKMTISSQVIENRKYLLQNCTYAIERLQAAEDVIEKGFPSAAYSASATSSDLFEPIRFPQDKDSNDINSNIGDRSQINGVQKFNIKDELLYSFTSLTHSVLIQEWEHFLYDIFVEGVIHYLKGYGLADLGHKFCLKNMKPTIEIAEMRKNISAEIERSHLGYERLFEQSIKIFKVVVAQSLKEEMKKQVQIRHVFQHNRGKIRKMDLKDIGKEGGHFDILNDEGKSVKLRVGDKIYLSQQEIIKLYDTIDKYSEAFQEQAEKIKLIS